MSMEKLTCTQGLIIVASMKAIFLADAHLRNVQDTNYQVLLEFLNQQKDLDALFLLGDIFEFWYGYENVVFSAYVPILETLRRLSAAGTRIVFVEGNHDFNIGPYFSQELNCRIMTEPGIIEWDGLTMLLCHGDQLKRDPFYALLRAFWRSHPLKWLSWLVSPDLVWRFGIWLSNKSDKHKADRTHHDPTPHLTEEAKKQQGRIQALICGHYHYPLETEFQSVRIVALGDWIHQFSYLEILDGQFELKSYVPA